MSRIYRYNLSGTVLTTSDLLSAFSLCQSEGCSVLLLEGVLGVDREGKHNTEYTFILQPVGSGESTPGISQRRHHDTD